MFRSVRKLLNSFVKKNRACLSDGVIVYCVGDIHGRSDLLLQAQNKIETHIKTQKFDKAYEIYLGDYIDRGYNSKKTLEILSKHRPENRECIYLCGNHEAMLLDFLSGNVELYNIWKLYGGNETLHSYGLKFALSNGGDDIKKLHVEFCKKFPKKHYEFLQGLYTHYVLEDYFFVHAGVNPKVPLDQQTPQELMSIRDEFLNNHYWLGKRVVHGHTPVNEPYVHFNRINIDTGAYITNNLSCLFLKKDEHSFL